MKNVEDYILGLDGQQKAIVSFLHHHLLESHDLSSKINWKIPTYYRRSWICYLNPIKSNGVELAFFRGSSLSNEQGILRDKGRKLVSGIELYAIESIDLPPINEIIQEAILLDDLYKK